MKEILELLSTTSAIDIMKGIMILVFFIWVYYLPLIMAINKDKPFNRLFFFLINTAIGFTIIGWIVLMVFANWPDKNINKADFAKKIVSYILVILLGILFVASTIAFAIYQVDEGRTSISEASIIGLVMGVIFVGIGVLIYFFFTQGQDVGKPTNSNTKDPNPIEHSENDFVLCPICGSKTKSNLKLCQKCGSKLLS